MGLDIGPQERLRRRKIFFETYLPWPELVGLSFSGDETVYAVKNTAKGQTLLRYRFSPSADAFDLCQEVTFAPAAYWQENVERFYKTPEQGI